MRADGSTHTASLDRGQVTASSSTSLTIKRADGKSVTFTLGTGVHVRGKLAVGGKALVVSRDGAVVRVAGTTAGSSQHGSPACEGPAGLRVPRLHCGGAP